MDGMGLSASLLQPVQESKKEEKKHERSKKKQGKNLLEDAAYLKADGEIPVPFGKTEDENVIVHDIHAIPHMLVCGFTGAGKTSFVQTILATLVAKTDSSKVGIVIVDSKQVEYASFQGSQHLCIPIIKDMDKAITTINHYAMETKSRLQEFANCGKKELAGYNFYCDRMGKQGFREIFFVLDDFSMIKANKDTVMDILDILRNGRIAGIHLILVSSVASTKVLQKDLISNIPCKIAFCLSSKAESRVVLEEGGAENLFVPGEMIIKFQGHTEKCQCANATADNISKVVRQVKADNTSTVISLGNAAESLFEGMAALPFNKNDKKSESVEKDESSNGYDEYLVQAGNIIIEKNKASIAMLQRVFKIGFNRASRIMDQLHELGVVGEEVGVEPREILMSRKEWEKVCGECGKVRYSSGIEEGLKKHSFDNPTSKKTPSGEIKSEFFKNKFNSEQAADNTHEKIPLRDFPEVQVGDSTIGISDNLIKYTVPLMTKYGMGKATSSFKGSVVEKIIYKKPSAFHKGFLTFTFPPDITIMNDDPHLFTATHENITDVIKIEFDKDDARIMWLIAKQLSEDIQVPVTVL